MLRLTFRPSLSAAQYEQLLYVVQRNDLHTRQQFRDTLAILANERGLFVRRFSLLGELSLYELCHFRTSSVSGLHLAQVPGKEGLGVLTTALFFEANDCIMRVVFSPALTRAQISDLHSYMEDAESREEIRIVAAGVGVDWNRRTESTVMFLACEMN